jgi:hypothetical protein
MGLRSDYDAFKETYERHGFFQALKFKKESSPGELRDFFRSLGAGIAVHLAWTMTDAQSMDVTSLYVASLIPDTYRDLSSLVASTVVSRQFPLAIAHHFPSVVAQWEKLKTRHSLEDLDEMVPACTPLDLVYHFDS